MLEFNIDLLLEIYLGFHLKILNIPILTFQ